MSHRKEREAKNCLNCNAQVQGRYCHICGQENVEPRETVWHMVSHFFQDVTHFDGKFFSSLKLLILRPGYLSAEYVRGRRANYLNPVRMYVFTSAFFFLIFFSQVDFDIKFGNSNTISGRSIDEIRGMDSLAFNKFTTQLNYGKPMNRMQFEDYADSIKTADGVQFSLGQFRSKREYDSVLASGGKKHTWLQRQFIYKEIEVNEKYDNNMDQMLASFMSGFLHKFPQLFFISLPLFALLLKLLYIRQQQFYYVSHAIFSIHLYIFVYMAMLAGMGISAVGNVLHWGWLGYVNLGFFLFVIFYEYKAMRNFYGQGRGKTTFKFVLLNLLSFIMMVILFTALLLFSFLEV